MHAYNEMYLDDAMQNLADMIDYAVCNLGFEPDEFFGWFITSGIASRFEKGNPKYVGGMSGYELADAVLRATNVSYEKKEPSYSNFKPKTNTYDYKMRNYTTSHVHMMLSTALSEMIDKTECIIFFNTPNSIIMSDELKKINKKEKTISPWIYHELSISTMLQISLPKRRSFLQERYDQGYSFSHSDLKIGYDVSEQIKSMIMLSDEILKKWKDEHDNKKHALDELYKLLGV